MAFGKPWSYRPSSGSTRMWGLLGAHGKHNKQNATPRMGGITAHHSTVMHAYCEHPRSPTPAMPYHDGVDLQSTTTTSTTSLGDAHMTNKPIKAQRQPSADALPAGPRPSC